MRVRRAQARGYRSLLGFSVRYNGVIRNKTEKTKETTGTRVGFPERPRAAGVTATHIRQRARRPRDARGQVYTEKM